MLSLQLTALRRPVARLAAPQRAASIAVACLCAPLASHALEPGVPATSRIETHSEWAPASADGSAGMAGSRSSVPQAAMLSGDVRNTVWARRGAASVGVGVQAPMGPVASPLAGGAGGSRSLAGSPSLLVGVAVQTSERSRLVLDTPLPYRNSSADTSLNPTDGGREVRLGLVIKPADPLKSLRAGQLFKLELSGRSQLALKPRSGGVAVSYSNRF